MANGEWGHLLLFMFPLLVPNGRVCRRYWRMENGECGPPHSVSLSLSFSNLKNFSKVEENGEFWGSILGRVKYADSHAAFQHVKAATALSAESTVDCRWHELDPLIHRFLLPSIVCQYEHAAVSNRGLRYL